MVSTGLLLRLLHCKMTRMRQLTSHAYKNMPETTTRRNPERKVRVKSKQLITGKSCRVCLNPGDLPIFGSKSHKNISKELQDFGGIDVKWNDTFPKHICNSCYSLLKSAILLRQNAQDSDSYLRLSQRKKRAKNSKKLKSSSKTKKNAKLSKKLTVEVPVDTDPSQITQTSQISETNSFGSDSIDDFSVNDFFNQIDFSPVQTKTTSEVQKETAILEYSCERCELRFDTREQYQEHILSDEHDKKKTKCPTCQQEFSFQYIKKHMKSHDEDSEEKYICDVCGKTVKTRTYLIRHRATHNLDLPFKCPQCPYRGRFRENIKVHMKSHSGIKPYKCPHCPDRAFINTSNLKLHLLVHNKGNQDFKFKCDNCGKGFHIKSKLRDHMKIEHSGIRDHICNICGKAFGLRSQMLKHQIKVHKREPLYPSGRKPLYLLAQQLEEEKKALNHDVEIPHPV